MATYRGTPVNHIVDVRTKLEFFLGHIPGAVCIPVQTLADRIGAHPEIAKSATVLVYCQSGHRSAVAMDILKRLGYARVLDGGAMAQARAGLG